MADSTQVTQTDLPAWYQQLTSNLGAQGTALAKNLNQQPLPAQSVAGFNQDQTTSFQNTRNNIGNWQGGVQDAVNYNNQIPGVASKFYDYAQGAVGAPAMTTNDAVQPWAQGAQDAASGSAQSWNNNYQQYMNPYTTNVVDNIARLGKRNWENNIMPGIQSSMIGSGQFGSTRNADILSRAGVEASNDITGQQSNALQSGWNTGAGIFANDANRAQQQQSLQASTALAGGNMMQGALSADANRIQQQGQLQAQTALTGGTGAVAALNTAADNSGALSQAWQNQNNLDSSAMLNIGNQQQKLQQSGLDAAYNNALMARTDPWTQLNNASGLLTNVKMPMSQTVAGSSTTSSVPSPLTAIGNAAMIAAGLMDAAGNWK